MRDYDIFLAISHGVHRGILKRNFYDHRVEFIKKLTKKSNNNIFGHNKNRETSIEHNSSVYYPLHRRLFGACLFLAHHITPWEYNKHQRMNLQSGKLPVGSEQVCNVVLSNRAIRVLNSCGQDKRWTTFSHPHRLTGGAVYFCYCPNLVHF